MKCELCKKNEATVHVTEIFSLAASEGAASDGEAGGHTINGVHQRHICPSCAHRLNVIHGIGNPSMTQNEWLKQLQKVTQRSAVASGLACPHCKMTLAEFRSRGRLGCPHDYEVFRAHLDPLLQRVHNATRHAGRVPGLDEEQLERIQQITELRERLQVAIREEEYESAARLRDELRCLEGDSEA